MARPPLEIDPDEVVDLVRSGVPVVEVAESFGCDRGTLYRRFGKAIRRAKVLRKLALLEAQWKVVEAGDVGMLIWLGKTELGQSDRASRRPTVGRAAPVPDPSGGPKAWELIRALRRSGG